MEDCDRANISGADCLTKQEIRLRVWDHLERHNLVYFPRRVHDKIPNFIGASAAAEKLAQMDELVQLELHQIYYSLE